MQRFARLTTICALGIVCCCSAFLQSRAQSINFKPAVNIAAGSGTLYAVDSNGDGKPDILVESGNCTLNDTQTGGTCTYSSLVFLNNGDGTFQSPIIRSGTLTIPHPPPASNSGYWYSAIGEANFDGIIDFVGSTHSGNMLGVIAPFVGNADNTFTAAAPIMTNFVATFLRLIRYQGISYVAHVQTTGAGIPSAGVNAFFGGSTWSDVNLNAPLTLAPVDMVKTDFGFALLDATGIIYLSTGTVLPAITGATSLLAQDVNGDGIDDLIVSFSTQSGDGSSVLLGSGAGAFQSPITYPLIGSALADFNSDGNIDFVLIQNGAVAVYAGNGNGTVAPAKLFAVATGPIALATADFNLDGKPDLVVSNGQQVSVLINTDVRGSVITATSSKNPADLREQISITVTVTPNGGIPPTGTVTLFDGTSLLGTTALSAGQAVFSVGFAAGTHVLSVRYSGDSNYDGHFVPSVLSQHVNKGSTTTSVSSSRNPAAAGDALTFTAIVAASADIKPTGNVSLSDGGIVLQTAQLNGSGQASMTTTALGPGVHNITAEYLGDSNYTSSLSSAVAEVVGASYTALSSSPNPSTFGSPITLVVVATADFGIPAGFVSLYDGGTSVGRDVLDANGRVSFTLSPQSGTHSYSAAYEGNASLVRSVSPFVEQVVNQAATTTSVSISPNPLVSNAPSFTISALVSSAAGKPDGFVEFFIGTRSMGSAYMGGTGKASLTLGTGALSVGTNSVSAVYLGDFNFISSTSPSFSETVLSATTATITTSGNPSTFGSPIAVTVTVAATVGTPVGNVTLSYGATQLASGAVNANGQVVFNNVLLGTGPHSLVATYAGGNLLAASTSPTFVQTVNKAPTTTTLISSPNPSIFAYGFTLSATVNSTAGTPTGTVTFSDGTNNFGTATLSGLGQATVSVSTALTVGVHPITASYSGDTNFLAGTSAPLNHVVQLAPKLSVSVSTINFPNELAGLTSLPITFTLTNSGQGNLALLNFSVQGAFATQSDCPATLVPQASCNVNLFFKPIDAAPFSGSLSIFSNDPAAPFTVPLSGQGTAILLSRPTRPARTSSAATSPLQTLSLRPETKSSVSEPASDVQASPVTPGFLVPEVLADSQTGSQTKVEESTTGSREDDEFEFSIRSLRLNRHGVAAQFLSTNASRESDAKPKGDQPR